MDFSISRQHFFKALTRTHGVADRKGSIPILSNILVSSEGQNSIRLSATDLYVGVTCTVDAEVSASGSLALSARTIFDIVKNLPEGPVRVSSRDNHGVEIRSQKSVYRLSGMPADEFPKLPSAQENGFVEIQPDAISELISKTHYSMSNDEARPHLCGALLESDGKVIRMVTTDGHRLSKAEHLAEGTEKLLRANWLVPARGVSEIRRLLDDTKAEKSSENTLAKLGIAESHGFLFLRRSGVQLSIKISDEQFPPYSKVIPQNKGKRAIVGRAAFLDAVRRISLISGDRSGLVRLSLQPGTLVIAAENPELGEGTEEIDIDYVADTVVIGFNGKYLIDVLSALTDDEVALEVSGALDPGMILPANAESPNFMGVVMPVRI